MDVIQPPARPREIVKLPKLGPSSKIDHMFSCKQKRSTPDLYKGTRPDELISFVVGLPGKVTYRRVRVLPHLANEPELLILPDFALLLFAHLVSVQRGPGRSSSIGGLDFM